MMWKVLEMLFVLIMLISFSGKIADVFGNKIFWVRLIILGILIVIVIMRDKYGAQFTDKVKQIGITDNKKTFALVTRIIIFSAILSISVVFFKYLMGGYCF